MNRNIILSGVLSSAFVSLGCLLKLYTLPFATILIIIGSLLFIFWLIPVVIIKTNKIRKDLKWLVISGGLSAVISIIGALFALNNWQYRSIISLVGIVAPFVLFMPVLVWYFLKTNLISLKQFIFLIIVFLFFAMLDSFFSISFSKDYIDGTLKINKQMQQLSLLMEKQIVSDSSFLELDEKAKNIRNLLVEIRGKIGEKRLYHEWPAEKVLLHENYSQKLEVALKEYNKELNKHNGTIPPMLLITTESYGKHKVSWCIHTFLGYPSFVVIDKLNRIEYWLNWSRLNIKSRFYTRNT